MWYIPLLCFRALVTKIVFVCQFQILSFLLVAISFGSLHILLQVYYN